MAPRKREHAPLGIHFLKEWREFRGLNQEEVADRIGHDGGTISKIETRKSPYTQRTLEALARVYETSPADLISVNPFECAGRSIEVAMNGVTISTAEDIEFLLRCIPNLDQDDINLALGVILRAIRANSSEPGQSQSDDQFQSASGRRES